MCWKRSNNAAAVWSSQKKGWGRANSRHHFFQRLNCFLQCYLVWVVIGRMLLYVCSVERKIKRESLLRGKKAEKDENHVDKGEKKRTEKKRNYRQYQQEIMKGCVRELPFRRRATLGNLCTGLMSSSTRVCLPHSGLDWLICTKWGKT